VIEQPVESTPQPVVSDQHPLGWTQEDIEMNEEEQRAEKNRALTKQKRDQQNIKKHQRVELPPRQRENEMEYVGADCNCGPEEACSRCIDSKGY
jgi:hypothetical protein